ncbi:MAG TPA: enoyl-CoA hydratase [Xanthobacteraceae bacterium]|nr:enoyl-CoA hydratase [Xanthobacteraceae bacterium]
MPHSHRTVLVERHPAGYAVLTLNRPEKLNALSLELRGELVSALEELHRDPAVRVLILTGAGRAFCAGLDLNQLSKAEANFPLASGLDVVSALRQFQGPVIGAINGVAATGGFEVALACDILIASTQAQFADTHAKVGLLPGWGLSVRLPRRIGLHRAKEMAFTARFVSAAEAESWGLVNRLVPPDELLDQARAMAEEILAVVPEMLVQYKKLFEEIFGLPTEEALAHERAVATATNAKADRTAIPDRWGRRTE